MPCPFSNHQMLGKSSNDKNPAVETSSLKTYKFDVPKEHLEVIRATLPLLAEAGSDFTVHFYKRLFTSHPELKNVFNQTNQAIGGQPKKLIKTIAVAALAAIEAGELPGELIEGVCQKHAALHIPPAAYDIVGANILGTIEDLLTKDKAVLDAWGALYGNIAQVFISREAEIAKESKETNHSWEGRRAFKLEKKTVVSDTAMRLQFRPVDGLPTPSFRAGQFTTIWLNVEGAVGPYGEYTQQPRHYTLALETNPVDANQTMSISVKREAGGLVSGMLHDAELGTEFELSAPFGCFDLAGTEKMWLNEIDTPVVFISGGIGVTPCLAMLENIYVNRPASWLHATQNGHCHAYRDRVRQIAAMRQGELQQRVWYTHPTEADGPAGGGETAPLLFNIAKYHFEGRMDLMHANRAYTKKEEQEYRFPKEMLHLDNPNTQYYLCGPSGFMTAQSESLEKLGVNNARIHSEGFA